MAEPFIGEIRMFAGDFAPRGWALCNGQLLPIAQNQALFSILGTTYGGDGQQTFALPDLRGRAPLHTGAGPGLSNYDLGEASGVEAVTLLQGNMPMHTHTLGGLDAIATRLEPGGHLFGESAADTVVAGAAPQAAGPMVGPTGGSQPHENLPPRLAITFIIALEGIFPPRN